MSGTTKPLAVTTREAAAMLSISTRKLYDLTHPRGPIRAVRLTRDLRYPVAEIEKFLAGGGSDAS